MSQWIRRTLVFFVSLILTGAVLELFLQGAEVQSPMENQVAEGVGLMYVPNFRFSRFSEGFFLGRTNSYGCLGKGAPREREGDEIRILFLGDSFALGHTVFERHHFARRIEEVVGEATGRPVTVLNFARADFAVSNLYQHYVDFASKWDHDLALFLADQNDLDPLRQASSAFYPVASVDGDSLRFDYGFVNSKKARTFAKYEPVINRTVLPRFVFEFLKVVDRGELPHLLLDKFADAPPLYVAPADRTPPPMPELSRVVLGQLAGQPRALFVMSGPIHEDYRRILRESGMRTFDLNPVFSGLEADGVDPYYWKVTSERGHWNHVAHRAIGEALGREVLRLLPERGD